MKKFHRINGKAIWINPDHVRFVEENPDTTLIFADGQRLLVSEGVEQVLEALSTKTISILENKNDNTPKLETHPWS